MDYFLRHEGVLCAEDVCLDHVAERFGTPTYVYSKQTLLRHYQVLQAAVAHVPHLICYAVKANGNLGILQTLAEVGSGFDAVSGGELFLVGQVQGAMHKTILSGVGKTDEEIEQALNADVAYISCESHDEVAAIGRIAREMAKCARISLRINPDVDAKTHPYISTGLAQNKFGIAQDEADALIDFANTLPHVDLVGLSCHIGSQIMELSPFLQAAKIMAMLCEKTLAKGIALKNLGIGGGLGVPYQHSDQPPSPKAYGQVLTDVLKPVISRHDLRLVLEPGRVLVGNAGILLSRVVRIKRNNARVFVILDAGMNDLLRPALYQAHHDVVPVKIHATQDSPSEEVYVVGPVCESSDTFAQRLVLPRLKVGDLVALRTAGAYGAAMASNYNGRLKAAEVLVDGQTLRLVARRQQFTDLLSQSPNLPHQAQGSSCLSA